MPLFVPLSITHSYAKHICEPVNHQPFASIHSFISRDLGYDMYVINREPGLLVGNSVGLTIERLRVRIPAGAAGEFSSPELTPCTDSYSVSVQPPGYRSSTYKTLPKVQVTTKHAYTLDPTKSEWGDYAAV